MEVTHVNDFRAAIERLSTMTPSLVITDLAGPGGRGEDLVEYIRKDAGLQSLPIIVLSGLLFGGMDPRLFQHRIDAALPKPVSTETFLGAVTRCLSEQVTGISADEALIGLGAESKTLDYKETINVTDKRQRASLAKDVIAFSNSGGGAIVLGVRDANGSFIQVGLSEAVAQTFEVTRLNNALREYIGTELSVGARRVVSDGKLFVIISIPASTTTVAYAKGEHQDASLFPGRVYIRNEAAETIDVRDSTTMNEILDRLVEERARRFARS